MVPLHEQQISSVGSVLWPIGSSGGHEGWFSADSLPIFSAGGPCERLRHGQGCSLFDVVHPAFPLPMTATDMTDQNKRNKQQSTTSTRTEQPSIKYNRPKRNKQQANNVSTYRHIAVVVFVAATAAVAEAVCAITLQTVTNFILNVSDIKQSTLMNYNLLLQIN